MVDERFNNEVREALQGRLKIALNTEEREATNDRGQDVVQTVVIARLLWNYPNGNIEVLDSDETVVLETVPAPAYPPTGVQA